MIDENFYALIEEVQSLNEKESSFIAIWNRKKIEVKANSSYEAQEKAVKIFQKDTRKKVKGYDISIVRNDGEVPHHLF